MSKEKVNEVVETVEEKKGFFGKVKEKLPKKETVIKAAKVAGITVLAGGAGLLLGKKLGNSSKGVDYDVDDENVIDVETEEYVSEEE